jgi:peptidoglycan/xylan/chitin deacetylase (PgdA/CDA1 family)
MIGPWPDALMYHYVRGPSAQPRVAYPGIDPSTFEAQLDAIRRTRTPISWPELRNALDGTRALPPDAILLTFDDGLADHHREVLPRLVARGLPGVFFVLARAATDGLAIGHRIHVLAGAIGGAATRDRVAERLAKPDAARYAALQSQITRAGTTDPDDPWKRPLQRELEAEAGPILSDLIREHLGPETDLARELYLDDQQLREIVAQGMAIGGHGRTHPWLDAIGAARVRDEVAASAAFLARSAPGPSPFAYPYGAVPSGAGPILRDAGFAAGFTTRPGKREDRYRIGRDDADDGSFAGPKPERAAS